MNKKGNRKAGKRGGSNKRRNTGRKPLFWLHILPEGMWLKAKKGENLWKALLPTKSDRPGECGGLGRCGKCGVVISPVPRPPDEVEQKLFSAEELEKGVRLACRTRVEEDLVVYTAIEPKSADTFQILKHGHTPRIRLDPLVHREYIEIPRPTLENPSSDFHRLRQTLANDPQYAHLKITYRCLSHLFNRLRKTDFSGMGIFHNECMLAWEKRGSVHGRFGIAFDLGTTTLVGKLVDLYDGCEVCAISRLNSQVRYGTNVISRIQYIRENRGGVNKLRKLLLKDLNLIAKDLLEKCDLAKDNIFVAVAAGNTTMQHFLLNLDPSGIAEAPFSPVITEGMTYRTKDLGISLHPDAMLYVMPSKSGYIGGDLIGFILASGAAENDDRMILGLDIGTNGEIFLGNKKRMLTCSAAAGPALEGARITHGMMAKRGAIESFRLEDGRLAYNVIGNAQPRGLCGSGLVDLAALLLHTGLVDGDGLMGPANSGKPGTCLNSRIGKNVEDETCYFKIASAGESLHGKEIHLTQKDVRELQLAKGAIAAGIRILMKELGVTLNDIDAVCLAGALGNYVKALSAMRIGLVPKTDPYKILSLGNAASTGAQMALLSKRQWQRSDEIADFIEHVELSEHPDFLNTFIEEMNFPEENLWE